MYKEQLQMPTKVMKKMTSQQDSDQFLCSVTLSVQSASGKFILFKVAALVRTQTSEINTLYLVTLDHSKNCIRFVNNFVSDLADTQTDRNRNITSFLRRM